MLLFKHTTQAIGGKSALDPLMKAISSAVVSKNLRSVFYIYIGQSIIDMADFGAGCTANYNGSGSNTSGELSPGYSSFSIVNYSVV